MNFCNGSISSHFQQYSSICRDRRVYSWKPLTATREHADHGQNVSAMFTTAVCVPLEVLLCVLVLFLWHFITDLLSEGRRRRNLGPLDGPYMPDVAAARSNVQHYS